MLYGGDGDDEIHVRSFAAPDMQSGFGDYASGGEGSDTIFVEGNQARIYLGESTASTDVVIPEIGDATLIIVGFDPDFDGIGAGDRLDLSALEDERGQPIGRDDLSVEQRNIVDGIPEQIVLRVSNGPDDDVLTIVFNNPGFAVPNELNTFLPMIGIPA